MSVHAITLSLPEPLYQRARAAAQIANRPLEQVLTQSIALSLPALESDLPAAIRSELAALPLLSDARLWAIARTTLDKRKQARLQTLAETQKFRSLTLVEKAELGQLMDEAELVMLRKAEVYHLLARRGHTVFAEPETIVR
ncbi:MAG: hypothetical protein CVU38_08160 [Chloroflexi bacterium HGW-Chloroflexi-1]|nr:MAG: hypothetical protein CVU38_08160 [Chloroflexi bacterium HGW-Chloroflexi-1]